MWWEVIVDALIDTLWLFPFLLALYILIELLEHKTKMGHPSRLLSGKWAPLLGTATGLIPMCGFSVMAAKLYRHRHLTLGALLSVFVATSDEGLLVLLLSDAVWATKPWSLLALVGCKLVLGVAVGYLVDLVANRHGALPIPPRHEHDHDHSFVHDHAHEEIHEHTEEDGHAHEDGSCECAELSVCEHRHESNVTLFFISPLLHALEVAGFVLLVNLLFGFFFFALGRGDAEAGSALVGEFMGGAGYWAQPVLCALVGLIPNCASSVVLAEVYALGGIGFGGLLGGLVANAGLGYIALFKAGEIKRSAMIVIAMFLLGIASGYVACAVVRLIG